MHEDISYCLILHSDSCYIFMNVRIFVVFIILLYSFVAHSRPLILTTIINLSKENASKIKDINYEKSSSRFNDRKSQIPLSTFSDEIRTEFPGRIRKFRTNLERSERHLKKNKNSILDNKNLMNEIIEDQNHETKIIFKRLLRGNYTRRKSSSAKLIVHNHDIEQDIFLPGILQSQLNEHYPDLIYSKSSILKDTSSSSPILSSESVEPTDINLETIDSVTILKPSKELHLNSLPSHNYYFEEKKIVQEPKSSLIFKDRKNFLIQPLPYLSPKNGSKVFHFVSRSINKPVTYKISQANPEDLENIRYLLALEPKHTLEKNINPFNTLKVVNDVDTFTEKLLDPYCTFVTLNRRLVFDHIIITKMPTIISTTKKVDSLVARKLKWLMGQVHVNVATKSKFKSNFKDIGTSTISVSQTDSKALKKIKSLMAQPHITIATKDDIVTEAESTHFADISEEDSANIKKVKKLLAEIRSKLENTVTEPIKLVISSTIEETTDSKIIKKVKDLMAAPQFHIVTKGITASELLVDQPNKFMNSIVLPNIKMATKYRSDRIGEVLRNLYAPKTITKSATKLYSRRKMDSSKHKHKDTNILVPTKKIRKYFYPHDHLNLITKKPVTKNKELQRMLDSFTRKRFRKYNSFKIIKRNHRKMSTIVPAVISGKHHHKSRRLSENEIKITKTTTKNFSYVPNEEFLVTKLYDEKLSRISKLLKENVFKRKNIPSEEMNYINTSETIKTSLDRNDLNMYQTPNFDYVFESTTAGYNSNEQIIEKSKFSQYDNPKQNILENLAPVYELPTRMISELNSRLDGSKLKTLHNLLAYQNLYSKRGPLLREHQENEEPQTIIGYSELFPEVYINFLNGIFPPDFTPLNKKTELHSPGVVNVNNIKLVDSQEVINTDHHIFTETEDNEISNENNSQEADNVFQIESPVLEKYSDYENSVPPEMQDLKKYPYHQTNVEIDRQDSFLIKDQPESVVRLTDNPTLERYFPDNNAEFLKRKQELLIQNDVKKLPLANIFPKSYLLYLFDDVLKFDGHSDIVDKKVDGSENNEDISSLKPYHNIATINIFPISVKGLFTKSYVPKEYEGSELRSPKYSELYEANLKRIEDQLVDSKETMKASRDSLDYYLDNEQNTYEKETRQDDMPAHYLQSNINSFEKLLPKSYLSYLNITEQGQSLKNILPKSYLSFLSHSYPGMENYPYGTDTTPIIAIKDVFHDKLRSMYAQYYDIVTRCVSCFTNNTEEQVKNELTTNIHKHTLLHKDVHIITRKDRTYKTNKKFTRNSLKSTKLWRRKYINKSGAKKRIKIPSSAMPSIKEYSLRNKWLLSYLNANKKMPSTKNSSSKRYDTRESKSVIIFNNKAKKKADLYWTDRNGKKHFAHDITKINIYNKDITRNHLQNYYSMRDSITKLHKILNNSSKLETFRLKSMFNLNNLRIPITRLDITEKGSTHFINFKKKFHPKMHIMAVRKRITQPNSPVTKLTKNIEDLDHYYRRLYSKIINEGLATTRSPSKETVGEINNIVTKLIILKSTQLYNPRRKYYPEINFPLITRIYPIEKDEIQDDKLKNYNNLRGPATQKYFNHNLIGSHIKRTKFYPYYKIVAPVTEYYHFTNLDGMENKFLTDSNLQENTPAIIIPEMYFKTLHAVTNKPRYSTSNYINFNFPNNLVKLNKYNISNIHLVYHGKQPDINPHNDIDWLPILFPKVTASFTTRDPNEYYFEVITRGVETSNTRTHNDVFVTRGLRDMYRIGDNAWALHI